VTFQQIPKQRGEANDDIFLETEVIKALSQYQTNEVELYLMQKMSDPSRTDEMRLLDLHRLRRAYEEVNQRDKAFSVAHQERLLLEEVRQVVPQYWLRHGLAAFALRQGDATTALQLADEALIMEDQALEEVGESNDWILDRSLAKLRVTEVEALLALGRYDEACRKAESGRGWLERRERTNAVRTLNAFIAAYEERNNLPLSTGKTADGWIDEILEKGAYTYTSLQEVEWAHFERRIVGRSLTSALRLTQFSWSYPNAAEDRTSVLMASTLRIRTMLSPDPALRFQARTEARAIERKYQVAWPWYRAEFHFLV